MGVPLMTRRLIALVAVLLALPGCAEAMAEYSGWVHSKSGRAIPLATVAVLDADTGALASLYSDNGVTPKANPFTADPSDGAYSFHAADGGYRIVFSKADHAFDGSDTVHVVMADPAASPLEAYPRASLPAASSAGRMVRVTDENDAIYVSDGTAWKPLGLLLGPRAWVPGPSGANLVDSGQFLSIGSAPSANVGGIAININGTPLYGNSSVFGVRVRPVMYPARRFTAQGAANGFGGGDSIGIEIAPTVHISEFSYGLVGRDIQKNTDSLKVEVPTLAPAGAGKPQDLTAIHIGNSASRANSLDDVYSGLWGIRLEGGIPSDFRGAIQIANTGVAVMNIKNGSGVNGTAGARVASMLNVIGRIAPIVDPVFNGAGVGFTVGIAGAIDTYRSGTHTDLGAAFIRTPTIGTAGGAAVSNFTTLKVGNAPAAIGNATVRALWVGTGRSQVDGVLSMGTKTTSGADDGDIVLKNDTGSIRSVNAAGTSAVSILRLDGDNRLKVGEGVTVIDYGPRVWQLTERADPSAPASEQVYVFAKNNGAGKTQLCARFSTGAVQCFAGEP
jgi:hypothetical protein